MIWRNIRVGVIRFSKNNQMQTVLDPKNSTLEFFAGSFFIYNLSHKQILLTLRRFKESFKLKLLDFLNKKVVN